MSYLYTLESALEGVLLLNKEKIIQQNYECSMLYFDNVYAYID
jgi:hypothetical protein